MRMTRVMSAGEIRSPQNSAEVLLTLALGHSAAAPRSWAFVSPGFKRAGKTAPRVLGGIRPAFPAAPVRRYGSYAHAVRIRLSLAGGPNWVFPELPGLQTGPSPHAQARRRRGFGQAFWAGQGPSGEPDVHAVKLRETGHRPRIQPVPSKTAR
jgi:hypothetical protein